MEISVLHDCLLASVGLNSVQEVAVSIFCADKADPIQSSVITPVLVRLHLRKQRTVPRNDFHQPSLLSASR